MVLIALSSSLSLKKVLIFLLVACDPEYDDPVQNIENNPMVMDQDGNWYHTLTLGRLTFMVENLRTTTYNDRTKISVIRDNQAWGSATGPACYWGGEAAFFPDRGISIEFNYSAH